MDAQQKTAYEAGLRGDYERCVAAAREVFCGYIRKKDQNYWMRQEARVKQDVPALCFVGHGRCGKDEAAQHIKRHSELLYSGGSSAIVLPMVAWCQGLIEQTAYAERHQRREFWFKWCNEFRRQDPTLMLRMTLGEGDICAGARSWIELESAVRVGIVDVPVWINRIGNPPDPTMEYDAGQFLRLPGYKWLDNNRSLDNYKCDVLKLARDCGIQLL